jgi:hypothetical protein
MVPIMLLVTGLVLLMASRSFAADARQVSQIPADASLNFT